MCSFFFVCVCEDACDNTSLKRKKNGGGIRTLSHYIYFFEIVNADELFCQLRDCDDDFDGYNH